MASPTVTNWKALPDFTMGDGLAQTVHPPGNVGYDIQASQIIAARRVAALNRANGILNNKEHRARFFVTEFGVDLGLSGTTGQGRRVRDFYPHNITTPGYKIKAICLNQNDYANIVEFVHETQQICISNNELTQLNLLEGGYPAKAKTMKGPHKPVIAFGVVERIERTHSQFVYAPTFEFTFVVFQQVRGIYEGISAFEYAQKSFLDILRSQEKPLTQAKNETAKGSQPRTTPAG